jgi:hypothetical protein
MPDDDCDFSLSNAVLTVTYLLRCCDATAVVVVLKGEFE